MQHEYIHELGLQQFEVVSVAFDAPGNWMATVEERKPKVAEPEINLKLWAFDEQTQRYVSTAELWDVRWRFNPLGYPSVESWSVFTIRVRVLLDYINF